MGEVYRARDTRLDRSVAIKVLPPAIARDEQARARFEREARAISALNHPNICTLFDVGNENGVAYLVMELIQGQTLAELLARGPLPLHDALRYAIDIATALDRAHRQGIVHRDLKPGNVMITKSGLKLLDFGLARLEVRTDVTHDAPTIVNPITTDGMILGTLQYMSPEQLEGHATDARTDIFSFGCILYEMITGRRAFSGGSQASIISAIMTSDPPPIAELAPVTPPALERLVKKCLAKSADDRWQSAGDLATELRWLIEEPAVAASAPRTSRRSFVPWIVAALAVAAAIGAFSLARLRKTEAPLMRLTLPVDADQLHDPLMTQIVAVSPGSDALVYVGVKDGKRMLWYRPFTATAATPIPNTEDAIAPAWSPDGKSIAFIANNQLRRTTPKGDAVTTICDVVPRQIASMAWGAGHIVFTGADGPPILWRVPETGGAKQEVNIGKVPPKRWTTWPRFDAKGRIVYSMLMGVPDLEVHRVSLAGGDDRIVDHLRTRFEIVGDIVVYASEGSLFAQRIDSDFKHIGEPVLLAQDIYIYDGISSAAFTASPGAIVYASATVDSHVTLVDRAGQPLGTVGPKGVLGAPRLSADSRRAVVGVVNPQWGTRDLWVADVARGTSQRLTMARKDSSDAVFSPDGSTIAFSTGSDGPPHVFTMAASGGDITPITPMSSAEYVRDWSPDGRFIAYTQQWSGTKGDIVIVPPRPNATAVRG